MTPALGDFLHLARSHLAAALSSQDDLPGGARHAVISELDRLITTLAGYFSDFTLPGHTNPASSPAIATQAQAVLHTGHALRRATISMKPGTRTLANPRADTAHPIVAHLAAAADCLAAGRDLLQTHFTTSPDGHPSPDSWQAAVITSPPLTWALAAEVADYAHQLAPWISHPALTAPGDPAIPPAARLAALNASQWLWVAGATMQTATTANPPSAADRELLDAIPANFPPPRQQPSSREPIPLLSAGTISTAERLRHASRRFAPHARWSPAATAASWRRDARALAITCHNTGIILRTLTDRALSLGATAAVTTALHDAADASARASAAWRAVTTEWDTITTSRHPTLTPVAAEIGDLVLWTGRLAYRDPDWTPARGCAPRSANPMPSPPPPASCPAYSHPSITPATRSPASGSPTKTVRIAALDRRLHITTRSRPDDCDIPYPYAPAPPAPINTLLTAYTTANTASKRVTAALDRLSITLAAPSRVLAAAHAATPSPRRTESQESTPARPHAPAASEPAPLPPAGHAEDTVHTLQISAPAQVARAMTAGDKPSNLIAAATTKPHRRKTASSTTRTQQPATGSLQHRPARLAAQDLPHPDLPAQAPNERPGSSTTSATRNHAPRPQSHHHRGSTG